MEEDESSIELTMKRQDMWGRYSLAGGIVLQMSRQFKPPSGECLVQMGEQSLAILSKYSDANSVQIRDDARE